MKIIILPNILTTQTIKYFTKVDSPDPIITEEDYLIGTEIISSISPTYWTASSWSGTLPTEIPSGLYYIGWIVDVNNYVDEFIEWNNWGQTSYDELLIDATPPLNPVLCEQTVGSTTSNVWQDTVDEPEFDWSGASDAHTDVNGYHYYWGTNPVGTSSSFTTSSEYDPPAVETGTHYLRVRTEDEVGNNASWTTIYIFRYNATLNDPVDPPQNELEEPPPIPPDDDDDDDTPREIPGYELFIILGMVFLVLVFKIIKNKQKLRKFS